MEQRTLPRFFEEAVAKFPDNVFILEKKSKEYRGTTYRDFRNEVYTFSAGLQSLGLSKGDRCALLSEGRNDWVLSELAILYTGAVNVPLSVKIDELDDLKFRLDHSGCRFIIVSGRQAEKIRRIKDDLPELEKIIFLDGNDSLEAD